MGGGTDTDSSTTEEESSLDHDSSHQLSSQPTTNFPRDGPITKNKIAAENGDDGLCLASLEFNYDKKRARRVYEQILQSYDDLRIRSSQGLKEAKTRIQSYVPGAWIEMENDTSMSIYEVPKMTNLLLIGPERSGKSSLINKIIRLFEEDKFVPDRAQVSDTTSVGDGTYFLQEHIIPRCSNSFCLYDTRGISDFSTDNIRLIKRWMTKGVSHAELVIRDSDTSSIRTRMKIKSRQSGYKSRRTRMVNFVIFVVNGLSVLNSIDSDEEAGKKYMQMIVSTFNSPYLSFRDDKPVIVVTHGDLLSLSERTRVRAHLGELLCIPPVKQIFDIPDDEVPATDLSILDMLRYSLEHSDRNLPYKPPGQLKICRKSLLLFISWLIVAVSIAALYLQKAHTDSNINWQEIRHIW